MADIPAHTPLRRLHVERAIHVAGSFHPAGPSSFGLALRKTRNNLFGKIPLSGAGMMESLTPVAPE